MSKRVRENDNELGKDPFKLYRLSCLAWLWVVKVDPSIRKCINKDIAKKIVGYLKVDLRDGIGELQLVNAVGLWFWRHNTNDDDTAENRFRPCVGCLKPISTYLEHEKRDLSCLKCVHLKHLHTFCCKKWNHSLESQCFNPFKRIYELPDST